MYGQELRARTLRSGSGRDEKEGEARAETTENRDGGKLMLAGEALNVLVAWTVVFALVMLAVSIVAYSRVRHRRLLSVSLGFGLFLARGLLFTAFLLKPGILEAFLLGSALLDAGIMAALSVAVLAR